MAGILNIIELPTQGSAWFTDMGLIDNLQGPIISFASMKNLVSLPFPVWLFISLTSAALAAPNAKLCEREASRLKAELSVPYHDFSNPTVRNCVKSRRVNSSTLSLFVATVFYYDDLTVRKSAFSKIEQYKCADKISCGNLYELLDAHIKATVLAQPKTWTDFKIRANRLRENSLTRFNELKNAQ